MLVLKTYVRADDISTFFTGELAKFEVKKSVKIQKKDHLRLDIEATSNRLTEGTATTICPE